MIANGIVETDWAEEFVEEMEQAQSALADRIDCWTIRLRYRAQS